MSEFDGVLPGCVSGGLAASRGETYRGIRLSSAAQTHTLRKLHTPSRCVECERYVYFQGAECELVTDPLCLSLLSDLQQKPFVR